MNNAALAGAALPTMNDTVDGIQIVTLPAARPASRNTPHADDGDFDLALIIARRHRLKPHIARLVVGLAGLAGNDDRASASGGRAA
jgi:hypothetical protein